jgi:hypothetical protein
MATVPYACFAVIPVRSFVSYPRWVWKGIFQWLRVTFVPFYCYVMTQFKWSREWCSVFTQFSAVCALEWLKLLSGNLGCIQLQHSRLHIPGDVDKAVSECSCVLVCTGRELKCASNLLWSRSMLVTWLGTTRYVFKEAHTRSWLLPLISKH